jgi:hypothetical protein
MTPKEKAKELINFDTELIPEDMGRILALKACDEIIEALSFHSWQNRNEIEYYEEVKQELKKYE